jgi:hypothetical protein
MDRYENFNSDSLSKKNNKEKKLIAPPVLASEIVADGLSFIGRNRQEYQLTIMKGGTFRVRYPESSFTLKDGAYEGGDLVVKMGAEPSFYSWLKVMLRRYRED